MIQELIKVMSHLSAKNLKRMTAFARGLLKSQSLPKEEPASDIFKSFEGALKEFFYTRQDAALKERFTGKEKEEYERLKRDRQVIIQKIEELAEKQLTIDLDDIDSRIADLEFDAMYKQGFYDGLALPKAWGGMAV